MAGFLGSVATKRSLTSDYLGKVSRSFKDVSFTFSKNPITRDVVTLKNEEAIKQAVKNLVLTQINERPFNPLLGTNTTSYLFELSTEVGEQKLIDEIERVIRENEPRVALETVSVDLTDVQNEFEVYIEYLIIGASPEIQELSFILVRES